MALDQGSRISMGAPGSAESDLDPVVIGDNEYVEDEADTGGDDGGGYVSACTDLEGDARRVCDLEEINDAILAYIDDEGHAPYLAAAGCGDITAPDGYCEACETSSFGGVCRDRAILAGELAAYIDPLPEDPCGADCYIEDPRTVFTYRYTAPANMGAWKQRVDEYGAENCGNPPSGYYSNSSYGLFADNLEDSEGGISYGFGSW